MCCIRIDVVYLHSCMQSRHCFPFPTCLCLASPQERALAGSSAVKVAAVSNMSDASLWLRWSWFNVPCEKPSATKDRHGLVLDVAWHRAVSHFVELWHDCHSCWWHVSRRPVRHVATSQLQHPIYVAQWFIAPAPWSLRRVRVWGRSMNFVFTGCYTATYDRLFEQFLVLPFTIWLNLNFLCL